MARVNWRCFLDLSRSCPANPIGITVAAVAFVKGELERLFGLGAASPQGQASFSRGQWSQLQQMRADLQREHRDYQAPPIPTPRLTLKGQQLKTALALAGTQNPVDRVASVQPGEEVEIFVDAVHGTEVWTPRWVIGVVSWVGAWATGAPVATVTVAGDELRVVEHARPPPEVGPSPASIASPWSWRSRASTSMM